MLLVVLRCGKPLVFPKPCCEGGCCPPCPGNCGGGRGGDVAAARHSHHQAQTPRRLNSKTLIGAACVVAACVAASSASASKSCRQLLLLLEVVVFGEQIISQNILFGRDWYLLPRTFRNRRKCRRRPRRIRNLLRPLMRPLLSFYSFAIIKFRPFSRVSLIDSIETQEILRRPCSLNSCARWYCSNTNSLFVSVTTVSSARERKVPRGE